jgi:hypothetical protein
VFFLLLPLLVVEVEVPEAMEALGVLVVAGVGH